MFYELFYPLKEQLHFFGFNLFRYITFRAAYAVVTALILAWILTPIIIKKARAAKIGETIRSDGPVQHQKKAGTPTMGGVIILITMVISILLWARFDNNQYVLLVLLAIIGFGLIGFTDDFLKLKKGKGISAPLKFTLQTIVATAVTLYIYFTPGLQDHISYLYVPFAKDSVANLGAWFIPISIIVIVFSSNAVNLTDGLDGLAIGLTIFAMMAMMGLIYVSSNFKLAEYLRIPFIKNTGELVVVCASMMGAGIGFLWFNSHPAQIFMGDTGALTLGGVMGVMAVIIRKEIFLFVIGGVFVAEALSVIIQVVGYKLTKKRVFRMAPLHHHFELTGLTESKVVIRFWIIGAILALISLTMLKIR
jgi:phospho-N-acetylmuramoyl-pentapeptide-transferase